MNPPSAARSGREEVHRLAEAILYEGYILYPYRRSSGKNRQPLMFGTLLPKKDSEAISELEPWRCQTECLLQGDAEAVLDVTVRFLHLGLRVPSDGRPWEEATERSVEIAALRLRELFAAPVEQPFRFAEARREQFLQQELQGVVVVAAEVAAASVFAVRVQVMNTTPPQNLAAGLLERASLRSLASVHVLLAAHRGGFVSQIDPPPELRALAESRRNVGLFPVLVGEPGARDLLLCAPIILYDYPQIAPESPGDLFDATEIDEILTLRLLTLSDEEKREVATGDERARRILARAEALGQEGLSRLHGALREPRTPRTTTIAGVVVGPGSRVRLRPRAGGDVLDLALSGRTATVASVEQDYEGRLYVALTIDDDPGQDLGRSGQPGHRFFFFCDEVEPLGECSGARA